MSGYIESLKLIPTKVTFKGGNPKRGAELYRDLCMECHRFNGRGELAFRSSQPIGLQDWYIVSQLKKYRAGLRGAEKEDLDGIKMLRITNQMTDASFLDEFLLIPYIEFFQPVMAEYFEEFLVSFLV